MTHWLALTALLVIGWSVVALVVVLAMGRVFGMSEDNND